MFASFGKACKSPNHVVQREDKDADARRGEGCNGSHGGEEKSADAESAKSAGKSPAKGTSTSGEKCEKERKSAKSDVAKSAKKRGIVQNKTGRKSAKKSGIVQKRTRRKVRKRARGKVQKRVWRTMGRKAEKCKIGHLQSSRC